MTGTKNLFSSLFSGSAKTDSTASTSSPQKLPDHAKRIREAAEAVDEERVDADLDALFDYISRLSDFIKEEEKERKEKMKKDEKEKGNNPSKIKPAKDSLLVSKNFLKLKDALSEAIEAAKDFASGDAQTIARGFLKGMGTAHVVNIGFLVVANAWERYEEMSDNQNACLSLLKEMTKLEQHVKELKKRPESKRGMEASIGQAIELIIEASIACCTQIEASKIRRFLSATKSTKELAELEKKLQQTYRDMQNEMGVCILDAVHPPKPHYPKYPKDTVGIDKPVQDVIELLEWESDKKAVAVILHGFGGMGKTTLADAVFARLFEEKKEGCKFSFVKLFQDIKSTPNVVELQESILFDLKGEKAEEEIRRYNEGQEEIGVMLEKEEAFIYIDNVLQLPDKHEQGQDALTQLLPENMGNAKKVRLLITARHKDAASWMTMSEGVEKVFYAIESLPKFSWSCGVYTKQGLSNEANLLKQFQSEFVSMLTNGEGKPLNISGRPLNTLLLVMFDDSQDFRPDSFPLPLLEESIDDIQTHFEMVYFGNHWDQLPKKVADRIVGHAPANRDTKALFQRLFSSVVQIREDFYQELAISFRTSSFQMTAEIVSGENGDKYLSRWKCFEDVSEKMEVEDFVVTKCGRYLKLKQLAERDGGSPIALLRELFAGGEEEISVSFLKNKDGESTKVGVDELQGKTILLDIRPGNNSFDISLHALVETYNVGKERFNFEIITVPIMQEDTKLDVSEKFSREVPWLVLQNPWQLTNTTKYFLIEGCPRWFESPRYWWYPKIMRIIESNGTFAPYHSVLRMLHTWGAAAFPFTAEKEEELIQKEKIQMEAIPHAIFLFQHLERVSEQLREATGQQKMICLWCSDQKEFPNSMKDVLTELSNIIYIIYIPYFCSKETLKYEHFTYTIFQADFPLEPSKISSAEMERMFSLSLSEYEAIRFWARIRSLKVGINATDQFQLSEMLSIMDSGLMTSGPRMDNPSWMFIMNEDGNLITTKGEKIVKLLSEKYSDDRVKELMQQLLKGTQTSWKKTLLELEEMLQIDGEHNEGYADDDDVDSDDDDVDSEAQ